MNREGYWLSDYNYIPEVNDLCKKMKKIKIYDTTLRDGEQSIGVSINADDKVRIAKKLEEAGVDRIEAGFAASSEEDRLAIERIVKEVKNAEIWGFGRCVVSDVKTIAKTGVKYTVLETFTSQHKMKAWNSNEETVIQRIRDAVTCAKEEGLYTAFFAVDATRTEPDFLKRAYQVAVNECGADEIVLVDTLGVATPEAMAYLTRFLLNPFSPIFVCFRIANKICSQICSYTKSLISSP